MIIRKFILSAFLLIQNINSEKCLDTEKSKCQCYLDNYTVKTNLGRKLDNLPKLDSENGFISEKNNENEVYIFFPTDMRITGIVTQGFNGNFVEKFEILSGNSVQNLRTIGIFNANKNDLDLKSNKFSYDLVGQVIVIKALNYSDIIGFRFQV